MYLLRAQLLPTAAEATAAAGPQAGKFYSIY